MSHTEKNNDYQKTLNLPQTDFSMKAGLAQKEPAYLEKWQKENLYGQIKVKDSPKGMFILHDGPPYANGNIHIGHALNKILKDFIIKSKSMQGYNAHYLPGWDCHGLPIEHQLLKEMNKRKSDVDCVEFRKAAHDYAMKYVGIQRDQFKRLGIFGEWETPYLTLDPNYESWILKSLSQLRKKGYVERGLKPVNWCCQCETALAEAEVEYENHTSPSVYVKFEIKNPSEIAALKDKISGKKVYLLIWTTTPWTLLANVAVAVHPEFSYVFIDVGNEVLVIETNLSEKVLNKFNISPSEVIAKMRGEDLKNISNLRYIHPFGVETNCCVVTADYVTREDGTGLVHTAPGHGADDFKTGKKYHLDELMPVNDRGVYTDKGGKFAGEFVFKANPKIIQDLSERGLLFSREDIQHSYPHCWRCKSPIISRATEQWFLKIDHNDLRSKLEDAINKNVQWIPKAGEERILSMVKSRPDWCLSRQRFWGVPIPALKCLTCQEHKLFSGVIDQFAEIATLEGSDAWFKRPVHDFLPKDFKCSECGQADFEKTYDILDVWFDSGVSHQAVLKGMMKKEIPADLYLEGSDQHRGWFQSSLIPAMAIEGRPPFKAVLTHGFVVDGMGRKMSKSLGNVVSPHDIIKNSGADILRLWVASSSYNEDIRISPEILERLVDAYRKIRNTIRYLLGNLYDFNPDRDLLPYESLDDLDQWALSRLAAVIESVERSFNEYDFAGVYKSIYAFCNEDLSSFYLDILKDRLYTSASKSPERKSAQTALYYILNYLVRAMAPLFSFTSEEVFLAMPKDKTIVKAQSVHLLPWLEIPQEWKNKQIEQKFSLMLILRGHVLKALEDQRRLGSIGSSLEAKLIFKTSSDRDYEYLKSYKDLEKSFIVSQVDIRKESDVREGLGEDFPKTNIVVSKADGVKCSRCWIYKTDVGVNAHHETLCSRCSTIVKEFG
jgi:isoleucyl-tRNA synthetase